MNTIRIATDAGTRTVPLIDRFALLLEGQQITFAVHPGIGFMAPLVVSEFTTGRFVARLDVRAPSDYTLQHALDAIAKQRERLGAQTMLVRMLEAIGQCARLNVVVGGAPLAAREG